MNARSGLRPELTRGAVSALVCLVVLLAAPVRARADGEAAAGLPVELQAVFEAPATGAERRLRLATLWQAAGASPREIRRQFVDVRGTRSTNLWVAIPGEDPAAPAYVIAAHTDATPGSPGAVDDWSGCVMLSALYARMKAQSPAHTFVFIGFAGEEHGQAGSRAFARVAHRLIGKPVKAMINLECLGVGRLRAWANHSADDLEALLVESGKSAGQPVSRQVLFGYTSDAAPFMRAGVPAITVHSLPARLLSVINDPRDDGRHIRPRRYVEAYDLLGAYLTTLDNHLDPVRDLNADGGLRPAEALLKGVPGRVENGVLVAAIPPTSSEYAAGLRSGWIVRSVDGQPVRSPAELHEVVHTLREGKAATLVAGAPAGTRSIHPRAREALYGTDWSTLTVRY
jgi:hypothetical protein